MGVHGTAEGETISCSATDPFYVDGVRYMATGYTLETSSDGGSTWGVPMAYTGTSYSYVNQGVPSGSYPFFNAKHFTNIVFSADVTALHPRFIYTGTPASGVLVLDFPKNRPTTAFATWMESAKTSQIVIRTPAKYSSNWTSDTDNFVPLADVTDTPSAAVRSAANHIIGQYAGCWLAETPEPGVVVLFR